MDPALREALEARGVILHAPDAIVIQDVDAEAFEPGVEIYPAVTICGVHSRFGAGTKLGKAGGGYFENVVTGRNVDLYGGYFNDCALFDDVKLRGHAEVRGGTLLEEGAEGAHHVGFKMTILLPWVVAGSLINLCDVLMSGGTSRKNHSEIGSALAVYNFTPWGDKHASIFGDVPRGVFQREAPVFIGGSTQIVSPVHIGFGAVIPAGCAVRRDVPEGQLYGEAPGSYDTPFTAKERGMIAPKVRGGLRYLGQIVALQNWYRHVRVPIAGDDAHLQALYAHAERQLAAHVRERIKRIRALLEDVEASLEQHLLALEAQSDRLSYAQRYRRIDDHRTILAQRAEILAHLERIETGDFLRHRGQASALYAVAQKFEAQDETCLPSWLRDHLDEQTRRAAQKMLEEIAHEVTSPPLPTPELPS